MIKELPQKILFAVYGTLKEGYNNNVLLRKEGVRYIGKFETPPKYTMVSLGGFPAVYNEGNTSIKCELYEVENQNVIRNVFNLEGYSGIPGDESNWYDTTKIDTPYGEANMFIFKKKIPNLKIVEDGNWNR